MEIQSEVHDRPDVSPEESALIELVKRIRKLRWMGMHDEAERLQAALRRLRASHTGSDLCDVD
jgi:hypothetical protein